MFDENIKCLDFTNVVSITVSDFITSREINCSDDNYY